MKHFEWADVVFLGTVTAAEGPSLTYAELLEANRTEESPTDVASMADLLEWIETANQPDTQGQQPTRVNHVGSCHGTRVAPGAWR